MGWAEKLPSGRYRALWRDTQGKRHSAGTYPRKPEAVRKANAAEEKARKRAWSDPEAAKRTWGEWADEWWPTRSVAESTRRVDELRRKNHLDPAWSDEPLGSITRQGIRSWASSLKRSGLSASTVRRCVHLLSASLAAAVDAEVIEVNPAARLKIDDGGAVAHERYLTRDEYAKLREHLPTERDRLIVDMLVYTGMRWGELAGLHAARVDLDRGVLYVAETWDEWGGRIKGTPKGKRPRQVPLTDDLRRRLTDLPHEGQTCGYEHDRGRCAGPLLLTTEGGAVLRNAKWSQRVWRPTVEAAGVGHVRIHDLRHSYASWLLQDGVPLDEVGKMLGHRNAATTQRYAHRREEPSPAVLAALQGG